MANLLDRFRKNTIGSATTIFDYLPRITASGDFKRVREIDVIINSWNNILITPRRSFIFDPEFGSDLPLMVFEPVDDETVDRIKTEIVDRIRAYDDRATIQNIEVKLKANRKGFVVNVDVEYKGDIGTLSASFDDSTVLPQGNQQEAG